MGQKTIFITGGTGKVGTVLIKELISEGNFVITTSRNQESGYNWIKTNQIDEKFIQLIYVDFYSNDSIELIASGIKRDVEILVFNARDVKNVINDEHGKLTREQFQNDYYQAVTFPYLLINQFLSTNKLEDILFISSIYGVVVPNPSLYDNFNLASPINYGVNKAAQIHLTKELAVRLSPLNIRVNCISYGGIEGRTNNDFTKKYSDLTPMSRMLNEQDLYPPIKMILSNKLLAITGENIKIDGGWTLS